MYNNTLLPSLTLRLGNLNNFESIEVLFMSKVMLVPTITLTRHTFEIIFLNIFFCFLQILNKLE